MRLDEGNIDLHGWLRAFYSCKSLGRSFVMDHGVQRPLPSYADFSYGRNNYASILKEVLQPLGLRLVQGKWMDAVVSIPPREPAAPAVPPTPLVGVSGGHGGLAPDSSRLDSSSFVVVAAAPEPPADVSEKPSSRRFRAKASGLLRSTARRLGFSHSQIVSASASFGGLWSDGKDAPANERLAQRRFDGVWEIAAYASDSLGTGDFARVVDFSSRDTARVVFGSEIRRPESTLNYENGTAITSYSSLFDGLTVDLAGESWRFVWRGSGSVLEVPGVLGSCASGSNKISFSSTVGVPFLSGIPVLGKLFSYEGKHDDELLITVCMEDITDA